MPTDVPVALIIFRRPDATRRVFEAVRRAEPSQLFVIADGPREGHPDDAEQCKATRAVVEDVDWDCEVHRNYSASNLGCGRRPASGISWVFKHVDRAIILEDDCLPAASFFPFCKQVLDRYADVPQVMHVNGNTYGLDQSDWHEYSYSFGSYPQVWGWATWKRSWNEFDWTMEGWPAFRDAGMLDSLDGGAAYASVREKKWDRVYGGKDRDVWDYQWHFAVMRNNGLCVVPRKNMITNVGFGTRATHTVSEESEKASLNRHDIDLPITPPPFLVSDQRINRIYRKKMLRPSLYRRVTRKLRRVTRRVLPE